MKYKVVYVSHKLPKGYIGNNYYASEAHNIPFPYDKSTVLVDSEVGKEVKRHSKNHEILEATAMSKEYKKNMSHKELIDLYDKCHAFALKNEKIDVETSEDAERLMDNKMAKFLEYLKGNMSTPEGMEIRKQDLPGTTSGDYSAYDRSGFLSREKDPKEFPQIPQKKDEEMVIQSDVTGMPIDRFPIYLQEYEALYHAQLSVPDVDIISHAELLTLHRFSGDSKYIELIKQKGMVGEPVIAWGPASVEVIDRQGHMIPLSPLKDAFSKFMKNFRMRNGIVLHTDAQVASIIPCYIDKAGKKYASGVNHYGLYILCEIRRDGKIAERVRNEVLKGNIRSFSIAGIATDKHQVVSKSGKSFLQIDSLELSEISLVERPANQDANFKLIKESDHLWTDIMKYLPTEQCDLSDGVVYTDENTIWIRTELGSLMGEYIKAKLLENIPDDLKAQLHIVVTHDFNELQKSDYRVIYKAALCPIAKIGEGLPESKKVYPTKVPANLPRDIQGKTIARVFKDDDKVKESLVDVLAPVNRIKDVLTGDEGDSGEGKEAVKKQTQLTPASCDMASEKDVDTVRPDLSSDGTPRGDRDARGIGRTLGQSGLVPEPNEPVPVLEKAEGQQHPWASGSYQVSPVQDTPVKSKGDIDRDTEEEEKRKLKEQSEAHFEGEAREKTIIRPNSGMPFIEEPKPERPKVADQEIPQTPGTGYTGSFTT